MTPEQRAEKIVGFAGAYPPFTQEDKLFVAKVEDEIRQAVEEEAQLRMDWNYRIECLEKQLAQAKSEAFAEGKRVAYEQAARIAERHMPDCDGNGCESIQSQIRALKDSTNDSREKV